MSGNPTGWSVLGGSALGGRHVTTGAPNQDSWRSESVIHHGQEFVVLAVADGHGGPRYVRSDVGSEFAVAVAVELIKEIVETGGFDGSSRKIEKEVLSTLPSLLVAAWSQRCMDHVAQHPFTPEEEDRAGATLGTDPLLSYGSTLLTAVVSSNRCFLLQLGDGDSLVALPDGKMIQPLPPDERLTGSETTSLCLPDAERDFRVAVVENPSPSLVLLASDGYGVAFADPDWRQTVMVDLLGQLKTRGPESVGAALPGWLEESARVGGDDVTIALAYRPFRTNVKPVGSRRRAVPLGVAALVGLLLGLAGGWILARLVGEPPVAVGSVTTSTTTTTTEPTTTTTVASTVTISSDVPSQGVGVTVAEEAMAAIIGVDGTVVLFTPNPQDPAPVLVDPELVDTGDAQDVPSRVFGWGALWELDAGQLGRGGEPSGLEFDPELRLIGIELENGVLWLLSEDGEWLVAFEPGSLCEVFKVADDSGESDRDITVPGCQLASDADE